MSSRWVFKPTYSFQTQLGLSWSQFVANPSVTNRMLCYCTVCSRRLLRIKLWYVRNGWRVDSRVIFRFFLRFLAMLWHSVEILGILLLFGRNLLRFLPTRWHFQTFWKRFWKYLFLWLLDSSNGWRFFQDSLKCPIFWNESFFFLKKKKLINKINVLCSGILLRPESWLYL